MRVYIMRHGQSPSAADSGVATDGDRPLSREGREEVRRAVSNLLTSGGRPAAILASPLLRAQQTAAEAASLMRPSPLIKTFEPLSNQITGAELLKRLRPELVRESLIVGHQPQLSELASRLVGGAFPLKTAGVIAIELNSSGAARLLWAQNPEDIP